MEANQNDSNLNPVTPSSADLPGAPAEHNVSENENYHFWAEEPVSEQPSAETGTPDVSAVRIVEAAPDSVVVEEAPPKQKKRKHPFLKRFFGRAAAAVCFGVFAGVAFFGIRHAYAYFFPQEANASGDLLPGNPSGSRKPDITIAPVSLSKTGIMDATETVTAVVEQTMPAMVSIRSHYERTSYFFGRPYVEESEGGGSGIIVGSNENDLLIATNYHVIEDTTSLEVILADNTSHVVTVKGSDPEADLAILALPLSGLSTDTLSKIDVAVLGDSDSAKIGQMVIAIGNALGYGPTVTVGYLGAKNREVTVEGNNMVLLQTDAAINSGNSGGALLNTKGEVIGINNAKLSSTDIEGICFAIPISMATPILDDLMTREILSDEEKGYLGVSVKELDSSIFELYNWPEGVYVHSVVKNGAAEKAGIYQGDIITHVNNTKVTTPNQLINAVTSYRYGTVVEITLQRINEGQFVEHTISVTLQQNPELASQSQ